MTDADAEHFSWTIKQTCGLCKGHVRLSSSEQSDGFVGYDAMFMIRRFEPLDVDALVTCHVPRGS